mgnify:CR=1 FL=1
MNLEVVLFLAAATALGLGYVLIRLYFAEKEAHVRRVLKQLDGDTNNNE